MFEQWVGEVREVSYPSRQGWTSKVTILEAERGRFVVKHSTGQYAGWLEQEERVLRDLAGMEKVPQVEAFLQKEGEAWLVMDFLPGETIREVLSREMPREQRDEVLFAWGRALRALHDTPVPAAWRRQEAWLEIKLADAEENLRTGCDGTPELLARLRASMPEPRRHVLMHGDFTVDNTLAAGSQITAIIDWAGGAYGDPRYDLALATRPKPGIFDPETDRDAFYKGYGCEPITEEEFRYFESLYDFF
ncbi:MAG: phosphotransferase [Tumebacillaceae bacterium]